MSITSIQTFAGALFGKQVGTTTLASVNAEIEANGLDATYNKYFTLGFGALSSKQVGELLVANLGIPDAGKDEAVAYVMGKLGAADASTHGAVVSSILADFAALTAHPVFGASATAWNAKVEIAVAYTGADDLAVGTVVGGSFTLTTGTDTITGNAGDDTITGVTSGLTSANTLNATDKVDGGAGADTLTVALGGAFSGLTTGSVSNVETINLNNTTAAAGSFSARAITGATSYAINANDQDFTLSDLAATTAISLSNSDPASAGRTFTTSFAAAATENSGTADSMSLTLNGVGVADNAATTSVDEQKIQTVTLGGVETAAVTSSGTNVVAFGGTLKAITLGGDGTTKITDVPTTLTSFDASAAKGKVTADLTDTTSGITSIKSGAGDDSITFDEADGATAAITIDGGAGADKLTLNSNGGTVQYAMTGVETLALNDVNTAALTFSALKTTDLTTVSSVAATAQAVTFLGLGAVDMTATANGSTVDAGGLTFDNTGAATVNYTALATTIAAKSTADAPLADYTFSAAAGALTVNVGQYVDTGAKADNATATGSFITANKATSLVVNSVSGKTTAATPLEKTKLGGNINVNAAKSIVINADSLMDVTVNAAAATSATITSTATKASLSNATQTLVLTDGTGTASKLETLTLTSNSNFVTTGSDLGTVQTATITMNNGSYNAGAPAALAKIANLTVAGAGVSSSNESAAEFGNLGGANNYNMNVTATGMKGGLTIGKMTVATGYDITANVSGVTGNVVLGATQVLVDGTSGAGTLAKNVTIEANGAGATAAATGGAKTVDIGSIVASGAVTVNAATLNNVTLGAINTGETGSVNVNLSGAGGIVRIGSFAGNTVTVNAADTIGGVGTDANGTNNTFGVTAKTSADIAVSSLSTSTVNVGSSTNSTGLAVKVTGGSLADAVTVTGNAASTSLALTGDLGLGTDSVTVNGTGYTGSATQTISVAGLSNYDASTLNGSAKKDVIVGGSGADVITGGAGQDILTGGAGADVFWFNAGDSSTTAPDTITDFGTTDIIKWGGTNSIAFATTVSGSAVTIANNVISFVTPVTTLAGAVSAVNTGLADTDGLAAFFAFGGNTYLFIEDGAGSNEVLIQLTGTTVASSATAVTTGTGTGLTGFGA